MPNWLPLRQRLEHAVRMRSVTAATMALVDVGGRHLLGPTRWRMAPWYAARLGQALRRPVRMDGAVLHLPDPEPLLLSGVIRLDRYEGAERYAIAKFLPRDQAVIEMGAGVGAVACLIDRLLVDRTRHWVVEANPKLLPVLEATRHANRAAFRLVHGAIAYGRATVEFGLDPYIAESAVGSRQLQVVSVPTLTFADLVRETGFNQGSLVCDIEGAEAELLSREGELIARHVNTIVLEVHPELLGAGRIEGLRGRCEALGYTSVWSYDQVWVMTRHSTDERAGRVAAD